MLTIACLTLHHYSYDLTDLPTLMLCSGTYIGFIIVLSGEIVGWLFFQLSNFCINYTQSRIYQYTYLLYN